MEVEDELIAPLVLILLVATHMAAEIIRHKFVELIRNSHEEVWIKLNKPKGFGHRILYLESLQLDRYIFLRRYKDLKDPVAERVGGLLFVGQLSSVIMLVIAVIFVTGLWELFI